MNRKTILITGCSSGFGRITALELAQRGWHVFATLRSMEDRENLLEQATELRCDANLTPLLCDITQETQVSGLREDIEALLVSGQEDAAPRLDALLNNAGTAYGGPIELTPIASLRDQMEINVIAHVNMIQTFLPMLKAARGMIINVSSISGRISTPVTGIYCASKYALEAISDALRVELAPFGVRVALIEPASSPTDIWQTSIERALGPLEPYRSGPYGPLLAFADKYAQRASKKGFAPELFTQKVISILESKRPGARYPVPFSATLAILIRRLLPDSVWDTMMRLVLHW